MTPLKTAQLAFARRFFELGQRMLSAGYEVKIDEVGRGDAQAELNALTTEQRMKAAARLADVPMFEPLVKAILSIKPGVRGTRSSLHRDRCAGDSILFKDGAPVWDLAAYEPFGRWWASEPLFNWGGDFAGSVAKDGDHFSRSIEGDPRR